MAIERFSKWWQSAVLDFWNSNFFNGRAVKRPILHHFTEFPKDRRGVGLVVSGVRHMNVGPGYYLDGWPSSGGYTISLCNQPTRSTQPCLPPGSLNRVPASVGAEAGMSAVPGGMWHCVILYDTRVAVAVWQCHIANCYTRLRPPSSTWDHYVFALSSCPCVRLRRRNSSPVDL